MCAVQSHQVCGSLSQQQQDTAPCPTRPLRTLVKDQAFPSCQQVRAGNTQGNLRGSTHPNTQYLPVDRNSTLSFPVRVLFQ